MCDNGNKMQQSKENRIEVLYKSKYDRTKSIQFCKFEI